jgi:hypothetical protein
MRYVAEMRVAWKVARYVRRATAAARARVVRRGESVAVGSMCERIYAVEEAPRVRQMARCLQRW